MTTPKLQAGWYPDPTGKAGQIYWDGNTWQQDLAPAGATAPTPGGPAPQSVAPLPGTQAVVAAPAPGNAYLYKNPVLYGFGGLCFPPFILFLMGGNRTTCALILGMWLLFFLTVWLYGLGIIFAIANYIWSVTACYQEAVKQNREHGLAA